MKHSSPFSFESFVVGSKEEIAIFMEDAEKEQIITLKDPQVTDVTIEEQRDYSIEHTMNGDELHMPQSQHIKATITIETIKWEAMWGDHVEHQLPDVVDDMTVEELLHAVNQKIEGGQK